ncbi:DUF1622 domain-containing protein [Arthrobacter sp. CAU 1506]|uniref:DUF1622 domain-containing protein n=1 Tax=Arthrobacter sp. CAU 1506 TaxID=2560052 RepID=UPI0010ABB371|nr:DUF1622 domain-containing protein [Arthrobacter sp. CAU 1506]TJY70358.1 DUF1622 domain-containing protein [Arthrobacter sp. CAU 1506]
MEFGEIIEAVGRVMDAAGVAAIVAGAIMAALIAVPRLVRRRAGVYEQFRRFLGRSILLGLELLVAADIIRTVAISPTLESVAVLAAIVLIRTFLSWSLELEITGKWPWQGRAAQAPGMPAVAKEE